VRTEVCITIDTEFSIGGAFADPLHCRPIGEPNVYCPVDGAGQGLPFLLDTFRQYSTQATFFLETLSAAYFGDALLRKIAEAVLADGHDVQLHLHPCWSHFRHANWAARLGEHPPNDSCAGRNLDEMLELIERGMALFDRLGLPRPIALRTGNLQVDATVYAAMSRLGLKLASNLGVALFRPSDENLHLLGGRHWIGDVLELPILSYVQLALGAWKRYRILTIAAASESETIALLHAARARGISPVVILTHPFEYVKGGEPGTAGCLRNRINQRRLQSLCRFIAEHSEEFVAVGFTNAAPRWLAERSTDSIELTAPILPVFARILENKANDLLSFL
jgi:peptidoglycan/xylan/chitin deacetylase (PgdA/CDA1 family)